MNTNLRTTFNLIAGLTLAAPVVVLSSAVPAAAQSLNESVRGTGRLTISGGKDDELREVRVELRRGGDARVTFRGRDTHTFDGSWSERRDGEIRLNLTGRENGDSARLSGTLTTGRRGRGVGRIDLSGYAGRNRLEVRFDADGRGQDDWPNGGNGTADRIRSLSSTQDGRGSFETGRRGRSERLDRAKVDLRSDGRAEVVLYWNGDRETLTGRWFQPGNSDDVRLTLNGSNDGDEYQVTGTLNLRTKERGKFDRFRLDGRGARISFEAK